jgi:GDP-4-dehydro-6-deoxy-D-mannose reductase
MTKVLITGATGFAGGHLAEALCRRGDVEVFGLSRKNYWPEELRHLADKVKLISCDLRYPFRATAGIATCCPDQVYHLAGFASPAQSRNEPDEAWQANFHATRYLFDELRMFSPKVRVLHVSSGLIYGDAGDGTPLSESHPFRPTTPYATSKAAADLLAYQYAHDSGQPLDVVIVRPFNHVGPRQSRRYALGNFASQIALIEAKKQAPVLDTGNLQSQRDLTDVRDMVQAYVALMERGRHGEAYNAGSGTLVSMQSVVDRLIAMSSIPIEVKQTSEASAGAGTIGPCANTDKLRRETGWAPTFTLEQTLADTLAYWRSQAQRP